MTGPSGEALLRASYAYQLGREHGIEEEQASYRARLAHAHALGQEADRLMARERARVERLAAMALRAAIEQKEEAPGACAAARPLAARNRKIVGAYAAGELVADIALRYGLETSRITQIVRASGARLRSSQADRIRMSRGIARARARRIEAGGAGREAAP